MGFEPMKGVSPYLVSSEALSTTQPTLRLSSSWLRVERVRPPPFSRLKSKSILLFNHSANSLIQIHLQRSDFCERLTLFPPSLLCQLG